MIILTGQIPRGGEGGGSIYVVSTDRDVPLIWVFFVSDLVRVWVAHSCSRYLLFLSNGTLIVQGGPEKNKPKFIFNYKPDFFHKTITLFAAM